MPDEALVSWLLAMFLPVLMAESCENQRLQERLAVDRQQQILLTGQPVPATTTRSRRDRVIGLYDAPHERSPDVDGLVVDDGNHRGETARRPGPPVAHGVQPLSGGLCSGRISFSLPQAEPNGLFTNGITTGGDLGLLHLRDGEDHPVYVETKVTAHPHPVTVDHSPQHVTKNGRSSVVLKK